MTTPGSRQAKGNGIRGILIKNALLAATCDRQQTVVPGAHIVIEGKQIVFVGNRLPRRYASGGFRVIDATGCVVVPGFINTHHHLFQTLTRNLPAAQDADLFHWLTYLYGIWQHIAPEAVYLSALAGLGELLLTGCTTSADHMYLFPQGQPGNLIDYEIRAAQEAGIRFHPCHGSMSLGASRGGLPPDNVVQPEDKILKESERLIDRYHDAERFSMCRIALAPCAPFNVSPELMRATAVYARQRKVRLHTHLAETLDEERYCRKKYRLRPYEYMEKMGWTGGDVWYAHAIHLNDDELRRVAASGSGIAHCPTSNLRLGSGVAPVRKMLDAGIPVSLGVDGSASNDSSDMLGELRQCLLAHRSVSGVSSMPARDVLYMATRGGADVLGRDDIGSLEAGKAADIALFDMRRLGYAGAMADPLAALLFCGDSHIARTVIVNGKIVVDDGRLTGIDERKIYDRTNKIAAKLLDRGARHAPSL